MKGHGDLRCRSLNTAPRYAPREKWMSLGNMASGKLTPAKRERELWPPAENSEEFQYVFTGNKEAPHGVNADSVKQLQGRLEESRPCVKWQTALGAYLAGLKVIM